MEEQVSCSSGFEISSQNITFTQMTILYELQNIISGNGHVRHGEIIQAINAYLKRKKEAVSKLKETKFGKDEETKVLTEFIAESNLWYPEVDSARFIGEGAEQKIYEFSDPDFVLKLNDSIFYAWWVDYFNSLLIHNYFFPAVLSLQPCLWVADSVRPSVVTS